MRWLLLLGLVMVSGGHVPADDGERGPRYNVLFIAIDDLRPSLGIYGDSLAHTPNLDDLARSSLIFDSAYVQSATCSPSRASLMTGLRPDRLQIYYSNATTRMVQDSVATSRTLNGHFQANGYETIGIGKIYHKAEDTESGWSRSVVDHSVSEAFNASFGMLSKEGFLKASAWEARYPGTRRGYPWEAADVPDEAYPDGLNARYAMLQLHRFKDSGKPFFMVLGFRKPHLPFACPKRYWDLYDQEALPLPERTKPPDLSPPFAINNSGELRNYPDMPQGKEPFTESQVRHLIHGYYACVAYIDSLVGQVIGTLEQTGLARNTIVVVWGDHGYKLGTYGQFNKHTNFEIDTRVPLLVRVPGLPGGQRTQAIVETIDIFPTLAELTETPELAGIDGQSFARIIERPESSFRGASIQQFPRKFKGRSLMGYAVRTNRYRYVAWIDWNDGDVVARELYDHQDDPLESRNLADQAGHAEVIRIHEQIRMDEYPPTLLTVAKQQPARQN